MAKSEPVVILHVITTLGRGGAERQLVNLVSNTNRDRFVHIVCCLRGPLDFAPEIERAGHKVINLNLRSKHPWLSGARKLAGIMRNERPNFVQTWLYDAGIVGRLAQLITRPAVLLLNTFQSTDFEADTISAYGLSPVKINLLRLIDKWTASLANAYYLPVSQTVANSYLQQLGLPRERVRVMYNSIDLSSLDCQEGEAERLRQALGIPSDAFVFLNVGRMDLSKGQLHLVRAFAQVAAADSRAYLVIVGDGFLRPELFRLAREFGIAERVCLPGQRGDIGVFLEMADVFVFPSLVEGLGVAPIEAMIMELPCIASNLPALREVFDDGEIGILVAPGSEDELREAMLALAADPVRCNALGDAARESAMRRFDNRAGISRWEEIYQQLATDSWNQPRSCVSLSETQGQNKSRRRI
jgi:glycosyltransferase involved in cell wall biosynthesis